MAIRLAVLADSSLIARKIADCPRLLCAAPDYLAEKGTPERPEDLLDHQCLLLRFPGSQQFRWTLRTAEGPEAVAVSGRMDADDGDMLTEWALLGQGIVLKPAFEVAEHLRGGRLVQVLPDFPPEPVTPRGRLSPPPSAAGQGQGIRGFHGRGGRAGDLASHAADCRVIHDRRHRNCLHSYAALQYWA